MKHIAKHTNGDNFFERFNSRKQWTWRLVAKNNRIVAEGGESYHRRKDMLRILSKSFGTLILFDDLLDAEAAQPRTKNTPVSTNDVEQTLERP